MIAEFLKERNMLLRGLAHPFAMDVSVGGRGESRGGQGGMGRRDSSGEAADRGLAQVRGLALCLRTQSTLSAVLTRCDPKAQSF